MIRMTRQQTLAFKAIRAFEALVRNSDPKSSKDVVMSHLVLFNAAVLGGLNWEKLDDKALQEHLIRLGLAIFDCLRDIDADEVEAVGEMLRGGETLQ